MATKARRIENRPWELIVTPITATERRAMAFALMDQLHRRREELGLSQQCIADMIDANQAAVSMGRAHKQVNRLDFVAGFAYAVRRRLVLVPWDDTSS